MTLSTQYAAGFAEILGKAGKPIRVRYFSQTVGSVWDDEVTLAQSGADVWTSGIVLPIDQRRGSVDTVLVAQGKLANHDQRLFVNGSLGITGKALQVRIGAGSPVTDEFNLIPNGAIQAEVEAVPIYKKVYITRVTNPTGSLFGE